MNAPIHQAQQHEDRHDSDHHIRNQLERRGKGKLRHDPPDDGEDGEVDHQREQDFHARVTL